MVIALQTFVREVDNAMLTDLVISLGKVSPRLITVSSPGAIEMLKAFQAFIRTVDAVSLTAQSKTS